MFQEIGEMLMESGLGMRSGEKGLGGGDSLEERWGGR